MLKPQDSIKQREPLTAQQLAYQDGFIVGWMLCMEELAKIRGEHALEQLEVKGGVN